MITQALSSSPRIPLEVGDLLEQHAFQYGRNYDAYLVTEPGWQPFRAREHEGAVGFVQKGRYLFVGGGLLAPEERKAQLLAELVDYMEQRKCVLTFFNIAEQDLSLFRAHGFQATKWGEEAIVDLGSCDWSGRAYQWVRRQANYCRRRGLVVSECCPAWMPPNAWEGVAQEVSEVSAMFLAGKPQSGEIRLLESPFDVRRLGRKRLFVARADRGNGRIEGFVACSPCQDGGLWAMETYRQRPDALRGTIPYLMHEIIDALRDEGVAHVSLCLIPGLGCGQRTPGDSALVRWGIRLGTRSCGWIYNAAGLCHYKSRFRPRFESRYLCARPRMTLGSAWALIRLLGVLDLDRAKLALAMARRWRKLTAH